MEKDYIILKNVSKTYNGKKAVNQISLQIKKGESIAFLGPNGAGKTTTIKMFYGRTTKDKTKDSIFNIFGLSLEKDLLKIKSQIGIVAQDDNLDQELSVFDNLYIYSKFYNIPKKEALLKIKKLLKFMDLFDKKDNSIYTLSGGMRRRITIARALLSNPRLLILDEPTTGLDPQVRHNIWDILRKLQEQGMTLIFSTHYMDEAYQLSNRIYMIDHGKIILEGNPSTLLDKYMEKFVLEILSPKDFTLLKDKLKNKDIRVEKEKQASFLFHNELKTLEEYTKLLPPGSYFLRQSNLEDLFLKFTGRGINE